MSCSKFSRNVEIASFMVKEIEFKFRTISWLLNNHKQKMLGNMDLFLSVVTLFPVDRSLTIVKCKDRDIGTSFDRVLK